MIRDGSGKEERNNDMDESVARKRRRLFFESYSGLASNVDDGDNGITMKEEHGYAPREKKQRSTDRDSSMTPCQQHETMRAEDNDEQEESTDVKLAMLLSLFPDRSKNDLLEILVAHDGCVAAASAALRAGHGISPSPTNRKSVSPTKMNKNTSSSTTAVPGIQTSLLSSFPISSSKGVTTTETATKSLTKKGKTLYLYSPEDIARHTPCSIIHNFLPPEEANALLVELLEESNTFERYTFQLFENTVQSPHTASLYVSSLEDLKQQTSQYTYNGSFRTDVRQLTPRMRTVSEKVQRAVNDEIRNRIRTHYPGGKKLRFQSPKDWVPNAAFVNCYTGPAESVGFHSDHLTYLGPRAVIGSLSLGVAREFRVRRVVARDYDVDDTDDDDHNDDEIDDRRNNDSESRSRSKLIDSPSPAKKQKKNDTRIADAQGQISIHLPHNSLLVMHAEMQEEWKHSIPAVQTISPHPIAGNRRINVTYRWYRESLHPRNTPRCRCGVPAILRCVQRKQGNRGRYMWNCYAGGSNANNAPGNKKTGCSFFQWAEFDDDGEPLWMAKDRQS
jgi:alkylated DNA repair dioxygenase AlkB